MIDAGPGGAEMFFPLYSSVLSDDRMRHCSLVVGENGCTDSGISSLSASWRTDPYDGDFFLCRRRDAAEYLQLPPGFLGTDHRVCPGPSCHPESWQDFFRKTRYPAAAAIIGSVQIALIGWFMTGQLIMPAVLAIIYTMYISIFWSVADIDAKGDYTRYSAVLAAERIMNPVALTLSYWGKSKTPLWVNWDR